MATMAAKAPATIPRRQYVKVPETAEVKRLRDLWERESIDVDPLTQVFDPLKASHRLTIGRFKLHHWYASVVSDVERPAPMPNALSGWGDTPFQAIQELAFRWHVLMRGTWDPKGWNLKALPVWCIESEGGEYDVS